MENERRYVLIPVADVTEQMRQSCIPYGQYYFPVVHLINGVHYELTKWRGDKPAELWSEYPVYSGQEMIDYVDTHATFPQDNKTNGT